MNNLSPPLTFLFCGLALTSCKPVSSPSPTRFSDGIRLSDGKVDPELVGSWNSPEETYRFSKDGTFKMHFDRMVNVGPSSKVRKTGDIEGTWSVLQNMLLMNVTVGENDSKHKMNFRLENGGVDLELRQPFALNKVGVIYKRGG